MTEVVDDRLIGDAADALHVIIGLGSVGLLLLVSEEKAIQNADATRRHLLRNAQYRRTVRDNLPFRVPALCSCVAPPLRHIPSSASFYTHPAYACCFVDRFALYRYWFRFSSHAFVHCE